MSSDYESVDSDVELAAIQTLVPAKSRNRCEKEYKRFEDWCSSKKVRDISEKILSAYFAGKAEKEKENIHRFLKEANDDQFLMMKVSLIVGVFDACRREEFIKLKIGDVVDDLTFITIKIPNTKTKIQEEFAITRGNIAETENAFLNQSILLGALQNK
ncbi:uncharacterized protein LOC130894550 [Diorhabda carinulata]|uniref:uncharacterized protein LOC130894550 n=1 Tax=Diorhabda carinulata TaxID=1163345 RepID=UPI0025A16D04|nr:uncharacterized protein LOC130894550 [Diorhabda carinulata]